MKRNWKSSPQLMILGLSLLIAGKMHSQTAPIITGIMAKNNGRKFWIWFLIAVPLPLIAAVVLLFLPDKSKKSIAIRPVENEEIFNHLFNIEQEKQIVNHESHFSATA